MLFSKSSSAAPVGDAVEGAAVGGAFEGDAVGAATAIIGACDVGAPVAAMPPVGKRVGDALVGDLVVGALVSPAAVIAGFGELQQASAV